MSKEIDHKGTDNVICPYCGHDNGGDDGDGPSKGEQQCYECEKKFDCEPSYSVTYYTNKMPCWNGEPHEYKTYRRVLPDDKKTLASCRLCHKTKWVEVNSNPEENTEPGQ